MSLPAKIVILSFFVQFGMTVFIALKMAEARVAAVRAGRVCIEDIAIDNSAWPEQARKLQNAYASQFELPMAFYIIGLLGLAAHLVDWVSAALSVLFVSLRRAHAVVHTGRNDVLIRFRLFRAGLLAVISLWVWLGFRLLLTG